MWIQNVSKRAIANGHHIEPGPNAMLIQIADPATFFPKPKYPFKEVYQFEFLDLEEGQDPEAEEFMITDAQAAELVRLLNHAKDNRMNVIVHCHAGVCRSGAVCEIGVMLGFEDCETYRQPNVTVKTKMMRALGWGYY